ncbi:pilus assembly protein TadG-related protein [Litoreibacter halocynthiae]|uniref:pilus assembly protein TadG-related protein n=1 Tax=Litoreibacter halocynthiae TaxID=1242689 RepID=UPI002492BA89|nr:pilus assembly protein TadG-related protein [Litoreibacter halocynthiae]
MPTDPITQFTENEDGTVAVIVSLLLTVLLGFVALGVDVAFLYRERAQLQAVSDLTAVSAIAQPEDAIRRVDFVLARNATPPDAVETLQPGRFLRNPAIAPQNRFTALPEGSPGINALRVVLKDDAPLHFSRVFTDDTHIALNRTAIATRTGAGSFSLDSHIANLDVASLNQALMQSYGASASLSLGDMQALANANIDLGELLSTLDSQTGSPSRNPAEVLNAITSAGELLSALQSSLPSELASRLGALTNAAGASAFAVSDLVDGIDTDLGLTAADFLSEIDISALDVIKALVGASSSGQDIGLSSDISLEGIISASTTLVMGEPAADSGWIALGEEGVQLHRAAVRLQSELEIEPNLLGNLGIGLQLANIQLPIYTELAGSTASLDRLGCRITSPHDIAASFSTASTALHPANGTSVAALYLGTLGSDVTGTDPIDPSQLDFADLLEVAVVIDLPLLPAITIPGITIQARSHVTVGASQVETITFTHSEVESGATTKQFGSGQILTTAVSNLLSPENTELRLKPGQENLLSGLAGPAITGLLQVLPARLQSGLTAPVDGVLDATLAGVGLELGVGELTLTGHHCEPIRLAR